MLLFLCWSSDFTYQLGTTPVWILQNEIKCLDVPLSARLYSFTDTPEDPDKKKLLEFFKITQETIL